MRAVLLALVLSIFDKTNSAAIDEDFGKFFNGARPFRRSENAKISDLAKGTAPAFLLHLYEKLKSLDEDSQQKLLADGNTVRAVYPIEDAEGRWIFDVSALPENEKVVTSEFRAVLGPGPQKHMNIRHTATVSVLQLSISQKPTRFLPENFTKTKSSTVIPRSDVWTSALFKRLIHEAVDENTYLQLDIDSLPENQDFMPILVLYCNDIDQNVPEKMAEPLDSLLRKRRETTSFPLSTEEEQKTRRKQRRERKCKKRKNTRRKSCSKKHSRKLSEKMKKRKCQRKSLHIDFNEIGWNSWIIEPKSFDAFYCAGQCGYHEMLSSKKSNHAFLQSIMNRYEPEVPLPCCVPDKLAPLSILYNEESSQHVVLKVYPNMSVLSCSCR
ncbi:Oidioi.mRNA.OKI2018_I69.PAR.g12873.t1.cds [Oikopleura dioica]|uniref:Oidioi.mRNA.OKI2018_I69.PAR.g12873.t1.cds n=1 Tax=Oikopleura dioica TaxID=34765 RepID=A0ABN7S244_OIKDI|nr:Oidioi.mRNA.OKI2018_I69.PAR.g12873.t1.cds [Oikopleura dioica]